MKPHVVFNGTTPYVRTSGSDCEFVVEKKRGDVFTQLPSPRFRIGVQEFVDETVEVHKPSVFSEIILWFDEERILLSIAPAYSDLAWFGQRRHDIHFVHEFYNSSITIRCTVRIKHTLEGWDVLWEGRME